MATKHFPRGLDGRMRDENGAIRRKRGDTLISTVRDLYGPHVALGYRSDAELQTVLDREGFPSLDALLKSGR